MAVLQSQLKLKVVHTLDKIEDTGRMLGKTVRRVERSYSVTVDATIMFKEVAVDLGLRLDGEAVRSPAVKCSTSEEDQTE